uniref:Endo/exonuclease/phosphatase domain-containing protein n=1 Tax=Trichuris muris TaxID=70415 RepID=A0A5S6Q885_TRIMR
MVILTALTCTCATRLNSILQVVALEIAIMNLRSLENKSCCTSRFSYLKDVMLIVRQKLSHWMAMALSSSAVALQADKLRVRRMKQLNTELLDQSLLYVFDVENKLKLLLPFTSGEEKTEFVFLRERKTPAADTFTRMVIKINQLKKPKRKLQKKKKQDVANGELDNFIQSELTIKDVVVRDSVGNVVDSFSWSTEELFSQSKGYSISIGERMYRIVSEMPMVTKLKLECHPMVGLSVYPVFSLRNGNRSDCQFYWYTKGIEEEKKSSESTSPGKHVKFGHVLRGWTLRSRSCVFVPQQEDVGRELCVVCIPSNSAGIGLPRAYLCDQPVDRAPANVLWKERHDLCQSTPIPYEVIRLLSYNILADLYLDLKLPPEELYFKYCPIEYQRCGYRISLLMSEIPGYKADLLCLQEVDLRMFDKLWAPFLSEFNLCGTYQRKGGDVAEGLATFFNRDKFSLVKCENVVLSELVAARSPGFDYIDDCLRTNDEVLNLFMSRPQVLQVTVLSCSFKEDLVIVVGNTHLHSKSFDCHIRLLQTVVCMMHLENVLASVQSSFPDKHVSVLFCGDLNSTPEMSVHKLLTTGSVHSDDVDWKRGEFPSFVGVDLAMHLKMTCLSNSSTITNVTENFSACLDYVEVLFEHRGLPSASAPSDHIPLVMDVEALLDPCKS